MSPSVKALRLVLLSQVHPAVVTHVDFDDVDGLRLDATLLEAAGFVPHEKVELYDATTGTRLSCAVRPGKAGEVAVCGASALLIKPGERITIASYGWLKEKQVFKHDPIRLRLDDENRIASPRKVKAS
jgi:aspartate 1-decarboxylase